MLNGGLPNNFHNLGHSREWMVMWNFFMRVNSCMLEEAVAFVRLPAKDVPEMMLEMELL